MNKLKQQLNTGKVSIGAWLQIGHTACAEILASSGYDWVCVDLEHAPIDISMMTNIFTAIERHKCVPIVRVPENDTLWIRRCLDAGAKGIIVPLVNTAEQAEKAVSATKYPPEGVRGIGYCRANNYGAEFDSYIKTANGDTAIILQIEHIEAINNLEEILSVKGIDAVFIGPLDLTGSMGITGELENQLFKNALAKFLLSCKKYHIPAGIHLIKRDEKNIKNALENGYQFIAMGLDTVFLRNGAEKALTISAMFSNN